MNGNVKKKPVNLFLPIMHYFVGFKKIKRKYQICHSVVQCQNVITRGYIFQTMEQAVRETNGKIIPANEIYRLVRKTQNMVWQTINKEKLS